MSLGNGLGMLKDQVFRIGHLGDFNDLSLIGALAGVEMGLKLAGIPCSERRRRRRDGGADGRAGQKTFRTITGGAGNQVQRRPSFQSRLGRARTSCLITA